MTPGRQRKLHDPSPPSSAHKLLITAIESHVIEKSDTHACPTSSANEHIESQCPTPLKGMKHA